ncbi:prolyl oligopeptidase family serine peptidase [Streptomyces sp. NBC_00154]|uniref:prolyl oligopeptidase family serine peptidase n=1 Tax=Streptomyces sp. NBC_00154 TaxID=2975670 RepID=UPI0022519345|nr:prolyl oligopeptidase family serine peptidase [Streptomyces sp. NBC_00154]MCX5314858.1 prolyl oligopeptidase family serine peptidase [Streptomyces sp. NBC_00154]
MTERRVLPYGEWPSPLTADSAAAGSGATSWPSGVGEETWWCANDPATATVRLLRTRPGHAPEPVLPAGVSVRNRSLGYGGRPYAVRPGSDGGAHLLVFTDHRDQRLYAAGTALLGAGVASTPVPLTPADPPEYETCWADPVFAPGGTEVWLVREVTQAAREPGEDPAPRTRRDIVAVPLDGSAATAPDRLRVVGRSHHFLSTPRISPDGRHLAWLGWDHPQMPWETTELMVAPLVDGVAGEPVRVLGGGAVSVPQAAWAPDGTLYAMADPDGWANLFRITRASDGSWHAECVRPMERECAGALWRVGASWFAATSAGVVLRHGVGEQRLALWDPADGTLRDLAPEWTEFGSDLWADDHAAVLLAASPTLGHAVLRVPFDGSAPVRCNGERDTTYDAWRAVPERRVAKAADGGEVQYVYYPPTSPDCTGPAGEAPPLLIHIHGGPTNSNGAAPDAEFSLFCSRGFAVAAVDYGGSTGYGRAYRDRLRHTWGVTDVEDSVTVASELASAGLADPSRTAIRGGSAGGWTTLAALTSTDTFCCGAVYYPISDPETWIYGQTHDFESRYMEYLVGKLPEDQERFDRVSPIRKAGQITSPLVMLQGADDFICRPDQAERIVDAVARRGLWHRYLLFEGEGHGFRQASSVSASLRAEAELYGHAMRIHVDLSDTSGAAPGAQG